MWLLRSSTPAHYLKEEVEWTVIDLSEDPGAQRQVVHRLGLGRNTMQGRQTPRDNLHRKVSLHFMYKS